MPSFFEGFAQGLGRSQEQRRLRDVLQFQREQQEGRDRRADRQLQLQEKGLELREQESLDLRGYRQQSMENQRQLLQIQKRNAEIQQEMQLREMDKAVLSGLEKVFDPKVPAPMRSLILKQSAPHLGIDPKSDQFKAFQETVTKLDSDSLTGLSTAIKIMVPNAEPGQITALSKGVLSGQVTIAQVLDMAKAQAQALREQREQQLLERELGGGAAAAQPMQTAPQATMPKKQGGRLLSPQSLSEALPSQPQESEKAIESGLPVPGFEALPPAKQNAVQRDMERSGADVPTEEMTPDRLRKSAIVFQRHGMKEAANFARLLASDLEKADEGTFLQVDSKTGQVIFSQGGKGGAAKFTEQQSKDLVFATRAKGALKNLDPIASELTSFKGRVLELDPTGIARAKGQSPNFQKAMQSGLEFLQAILRKDTGAAITAQEQEEYGRVYLPQPGDLPEVLTQKKASRRRAVIALEAGMSPEQMLKLEVAEQQEAEQPTPKTQAEFDKLPSGTLYTDPDDGKPYRKP